MLRPESRLTPGLLSSSDAFAMPAFPRVAAASERGQDAGFAPLAAEVTREVREFIENGSALASMSASPHARWLATQAAQAGVPGMAPAQDGEAGRVDAVPSGEEAGAKLGAGQRDFLSRIEPWAKVAAAALGVAPEVVQAHAALESGWGRRPLTTAGGADSHNLFSLKASSAWRGEVVNSLTTEYEGGEAVKRTEAFRRYDSLGEAFGDYVRLLTGNARYRAALNTGGNAAAFAQALAQGGYATDPAYASKLTRLAQQIVASR